MKTSPVYNRAHIRPLAVSPLTHSESEPNPWGFFFVGLTSQEAT